MSKKFVTCQDISVFDQEGQQSGFIRTILINSPETANAFSADIMTSLSEEFHRVNSEQQIRAVILSGAGKHFSAGANLEWMKESAKLSHKDNIVESEKLIKLFESLNDIKVPVLCVVRGAAYGGALGLVAAADFAFATETAKFCLSETKLGLLPAVILPYLSRKMSSGQLRRMGLTARVFDSAQAEKFGLVELSTTNATLADSIIEECNLLLSSGPRAQAAYKKLHQSLISESHAQGQKTVEAIANARKGEEAQGGLAAFFQKEKPQYFASIDEDAVKSFFS